jgi:hypothetical protein
MGDDVQQNAYKLCHSYSVVEWSFLDEGVHEQTFHNAVCYSVVNQRLVPRYRQERVIHQTAVAKISCFMILGSLISFRNAL